MKIVLPEQIKLEQHAELWDTEKGFVTYLSHVNDFQDERFLI